MKVESKLVSMKNMYLLLNYNLILLLLTYYYNIDYLQIELLTRSLILTNDQLKKVEALLRHSFKEGLKRETNPIAPVKMFPTFIRDVPTGKDKYGKHEKE